MVRLDHSLLASARGLATEMQAQAARFAENRANLEQRQTVIQERSRSVMRHAREAIANAERVQERSLQLNLRIDKALQLIAGLDEEQI